MNYECSAKRGCSIKKLVKMIRSRDLVPLSAMEKKKKMAAVECNFELDEVTLSAKNHLQSLSDGLWELFKADSLADLTLTCQGTTFRVHRLLLAIFSPILKDALLSSDSDDGRSISEGEEKTSHLNLDYVSEEEAHYIQYLVEFLYRGKVTLRKEGLETLLQTARVLAVKDLVDTIEEFIDDEGVQVKGHDNDAGSSGRGDPPVGGRLKRKRKRKPVKVTKMVEDKGSTKERTRSSVRVARRASLRAMELARICEMSSSEDAMSDRQHSKSKESQSDESDGGANHEPVPSPERANEEEDPKAEEEMEDENGEAREELDENSDESTKGAKGAKRQRRKPREPRKMVHKPCKEKGEPKQSSTKEYRKMWRQTRPVMQCDYCDYETRDKTSFKSHVARHDPSAERFSCDICSKSFRSKKGIRCHMRGHGNPDYLHKCTHCNFHTPQKWNWLQHLAVIHKVDPDGNPLLENIKCDQCQFQCVANHQLKAHVLRRHTLDKPYKCSECHYSTVIKHELEKHISIRHKNERFYMCDSCGFRSQTQGGLTRHKRSHTGEKPFKCDLCQMCYADRGKLKIHLLRHTSDEKPFVCHQCGHACRRRDNLRMHLKRIHGAILESEGGNSRFHNYSSEYPKQELSSHSQFHAQDLQSHEMDVAQEQTVTMELVPEHSLQSQNVHVEQLVVLQSVPSSLQCMNDEQCLQIVGDENSLHILQAVTSALDAGLPLACNVRQNQANGK